MENEKPFDITEEVGNLAEDLLSDDDPGYIFAEMAHLCLRELYGLPQPDSDNLILKKLLDLLYDVPNLES